MRKVDRLFLVIDKVLSFSLYGSRICRGRSGIIGRVGRICIVGRRLRIRRSLSRRLRSRCRRGSRGWGHGGFLLIRVSVNYVRGPQTVKMTAIFCIINVVFEKHLIFFFKKQQKKTSKAVCYFISKLNFTGS